MECDVGEYAGTDGVHDVIGDAVRVHPTRLMSHIGDEDDHRREEAYDLQHHQSRSSTNLTISSTARSSGPSIEQPLAQRCPPPPNLSAMQSTSTRPLLRRLTRKRPSGSSRKKSAVSMPSIPSA